MEPHIGFLGYAANVLRLRNLSFGGKLDWLLRSHKEIVYRDYNIVDFVSLSVHCNASFGIDMVCEHARWGIEFTS